MARERKFSIEDLFQTTRQLLLQLGYEGFTFSVLAERLEVSRGTLYKYYENKEDLIMDFMIDEMNQFLLDLEDIDHQQGFEAQFDFLIEIIFKKTEIQQLIEVAQQIPKSASDKVRENKEKLEYLHLDMYKYLQNFIVLGREEGRLKHHIPDALMLGFIFQSIAIPNHFGIPHAEWVSSIKEIICHGMFASK